MLLYSINPLPSPNMYTPPWWLTIYVVIFYQPSPLTKYVHTTLVTIENFILPVNKQQPIINYAFLLHMHVDTYRKNGFLPQNLYQKIQQVIYSI